MADSSAPTLIQRAWELCYLDPLAAGALAREVLALRPATLPAAVLGPAWLHVALAEVRAGDADVAREALARAHGAYLMAEDPLGLVWCGEVEAIVLRRKGDYSGSAKLQAALVANTTLPQPDLLQFVAHNSRAITAKLLGQTDDALRHFYAARDAAERTGWAGPRITALANLGGYHQDLYNLDDARRLSEESLAAAREAGAWHAAATAASNLVMIHHAAGDHQQARHMVDVLHTHEAQLPPGSLQRLALFLALGHLGVGETALAQRHLQDGAVAGVADGDGVVLWGWLKARCHLALGDAPAARQVAEETLQRQRSQRLSEPPFETMQLHHALADACEATGDTTAALACMRRVHRLYEQLVGRSARARYIALEVGHRLADAHRQRDQALDNQRSAESDRQRLAELNAALQAQMAETGKLHAQLREQALRDPLTGLHNRRYLFETAPAMLELARRQGHPLCVVLLDLDHFKQLNDTYGHQAGDEALQRFATLLQQMLRRSDLVCRHGGEEFVAVMPDVEPTGAQPMLQRLLQAYRFGASAPGGEGSRRRPPAGTFSAGVVQFPLHGHTLELLLSRADRALYRAKHEGRARIELAPQTGFGTLV